MLRAEAKARRKQRDDIERRWGPYIALTGRAEGLLAELDALLAGHPGMHDARTALGAVRREVVDKPAHRRAIIAQLDARLAEIGEE